MNGSKRSNSSTVAPRVAWAVLMLAALAIVPERPAQAQIYQELYAFRGGPDGYGPEGALVQGADQYFYGTCADGGQPTSNCGTCGYGTVFKIAPEGALTTPAWFNGTTNGRYPF